MTLESAEPEQRVRARIHHGCPFGKHEELLSGVDSNVPAERRKLCASASRTSLAHRADALEGDVATVGRCQTSLGDQLSHRPRCSAAIAEQHGLRRPASSHAAAD